MAYFSEYYQLYFLILPLLVHCSKLIKNMLVSGLNGISSFIEHHAFSHKFKKKKMWKLISAEYSNTLGQQTVDSYYHGPRDYRSLLIPFSFLPSYRLPILSIGWNQSETSGPEVLTIHL